MPAVGIDMPTITPSLWFDGNAEDAAAFYASVFPHSSVDSAVRYTDAGPGPAGEVAYVTFTLDGQRFIGINGGPQFRFTEAISFEITCRDQAEVDHYWDSLLAGGGEESMCGWLKDRYGLSWQVVPARLYELVTDPDPARASAATQAMLGMRRIVVADLEAAADDAVPARG